MAGSEAAAPPEEEAGACAGPSPAKSPLEKPLSELTEEDIAQVTREDCRRFLKEKGMRRPSWNKSQAVQQVISLKALLEACHDADDDAASDCAAPSISSLFAKTPSDDLLPVVGGPFPLAATLREQRPRGSDPSASGFACTDPVCRPPARGTGNLPSSEVAAATDLEGQLTIFYDGKISVYDGVTPEKAQVILQAAGSRSCYDLPPASSPSPSPSLYSTRSLRCHQQSLPAISPGTGGGSFNPPPLQGASPLYLHVPQSSERPPPQQFREGLEEWKGQRDVEPEGPTSRAASVQRYLEKRKDRFKCKRPPIAAASTVELLLGQRMSDIYAAAPPPPPPPPRSSLRITIDLNDSA